MVNPPPDAQHNGIAISASGRDEQDSRTKLGQLEKDKAPAAMDRADHGNGRMVDLIY